LSLLAAEVRSVVSVEVLRGSRRKLHAFEIGTEPRSEPTVIGCLWTTLYGTVPSRLGTYSLP
jgi:hypothetical protein